MRNATDTGEKPERTVQSVYLCVHTVNLIMDFTDLSDIPQLGLMELNPLHYGEMIFSTAANPDRSLPLFKDRKFYLRKRGNYDRF